MIAQLSQNEDKQGLKIIFLIVFFLCSITVTFNVMLGEIEVMKSFAITEWQKSFFKCVFAALAIATAIIIPSTVIIKKIGLSRWLPVGVTLSILLLVYELCALDHIILRTGMDNSDVHKQNSLAYQSLESGIAKLKPQDIKIEVEAGTDNTKQVLDISNALTTAQKQLGRCLSKDNACKRAHKAEITAYKTQLKTFSEITEQQNQVHSNVMDNIKAVKELHEIAKNDDAEIVAAPAFRMLTGDNELALFYQKVFSHFVAVLITAFNTLSMMMVGGLAASLGVGESLKRYSTSEHHPAPSSSPSHSNSEPTIAEPAARENLATENYQPSLSEVFRNSPAYQPTAYSVNTELNTPNTANTQPVFERGHGQCLNENTVSELEYSNNDGDYSSSNIGFFRGVSAENTVENTDVCIESDTDTVNTADTAKNTDERNSSVFALDALRKAVLNGNFFSSERMVGVRSVIRFLRGQNIKCNQNTAVDLVIKLKEEGLVDEHGEKK
jgi:hypothetical protein